MPPTTNPQQQIVQEVLKRMANDADAISRVLEGDPELADWFASNYPFNFPWEEMSLKLNILRTGQAQGVLRILDWKETHDGAMLFFADFSEAPLVGNMVEANADPASMIEYQQWFDETAMLNILVNKLARVENKGLEHALDRLKQILKKKES